MPSVVTVPELRAQLNLDSDHDDALLSQKIDAAEAYCASYVGGYLADPYSAAVKQAVIMLAAYWYESREAATVGGNPYVVPFGVHDLLQAHRMWVV